MPERIEPSELEGPVVLVGVTQLEKDGSYSPEQFAGLASIEDQQAYALVRIICDNGESREYPCDARSLQRASPGEYRLRSSGKVITNPDFLMTWTVTKE